MKRSEIFVQVKETLIETLGLEDGEKITPQSKLIGDLGAESIDFLDIMARLERRFDITLDTAGEEVERVITEMVSEEELETGIIPPELLARLPELLPELDPAEFREDLRLNEIPLLYTVDSMITMVIRVLEEQCNIEVENDMMSN